MDRYHDDIGMNAWWDQINTPAKHGLIVPRARRTVRPENLAAEFNDVKMKEHLTFQAMCWQEFFVLAFNAPSVISVAEQIEIHNHPIYGGRK